MFERLGFMTRPPPAGDQQAEAGNLNPDHSGNPLKVKASKRAGDHHQHCPPERRHHIEPRTPCAVNADNEIEQRERGNAGRQLGADDRAAMHGEDGAALARWT